MASQGAGVTYPLPAEPALMTYALLISLSILIYDYLITLEREINYIWRTRWHLGTLIFLINRYLPFINGVLSLRLVTSIVPPETCRIQLTVVSWLITLSFAVSELILILRTIALWDKKKSIIIILFITLFIGVFAAIIATRRFFSALEYLPVGFRLGCKFNNTKRIILLDFAAILFIETTIFILTMIRAVHHLRHSNSTWIYELYRRGIMFYIFLFAVTIINVILPLSLPQQGSKTLFAAFQQTLHSVLCNRVVFQINQQRAEYAQRQSRRTSQHSDGVVFTSVIDTYKTPGDDHQNVTQSTELDVR